ncbi:MAG: glycosyltransferase [Candidatus Kerfeldbacteria bacterium]|nr:glycosyltransferase [Candidatus Kerfeldbacteria bacterium]
MPTVSVIIASSHEPRTIARAVMAFLHEDARCDVCVVAPDAETLNAAQGVADARVHTVHDDGKGKPAALNRAIGEVKGDIVVFSDGDVKIQPGALNALIRPFSDERVGAVSGHPISANARGTRWGYIAHLLTDMAHRLRKERAEAGELIDASGYLMAMRRAGVDPLPENTLADDPVLTFMAHTKGYRVAYAPDALVSVKYPTNVRDWMKQKTRSFGGYIQPYVRSEHKRMRSFWQEVRHLGWVLTYPKTIREVWWTVELLVLRLLAWALAGTRVRILKQPLDKIWQRVDSTK